MPASGDGVRDVLKTLGLSTSGSCGWRQTITLGEVGRKQSFSNGFLYKRERFFGFSCLCLRGLGFELQGRQSIFLRSDARLSVLKRSGRVL